MQDANRPDPVEDQREDDALLLAVGQGDRRAFELLAIRHTGRLVRLAWRYSGQLATAEDLVQEALVRVWTRAGQWNGSRGSVRSWMDRIMVNICIDHARNAHQTSGIEALEDRADTTSDPDDILAGKQMDRAIRNTIDALPERQRAALSLCFSQERSCAEGARILGVSVPTMESLLLRGRRTVRKRLLELGFIVEA